MTGNFDTQWTPTLAEQAAGVEPGGAEDSGAVDLVMGVGEPQRIGRFRFFLDCQRWEWSDALARMHGYQPGTVVPTTELLLEHKHPDDRLQVAAVLDRVLLGEAFASRHRIIDTAGDTHWVIVVGDRMHDAAGNLIGTSGFYIDVTEGHRPDGDVSDVAAARDRIEQAKGVLMAVYDIPADRAFDILVWRSQETNIKVRELAAQFMTSLAGRMPADIRHHVDHALLTLE